LYKTYFKRSIDFIAALLGLLLLSPLLIIFTVGLFFTNQGKPFFFQTRPGKDEKLFKIVKFKTMTDAKDTKGNLLPDAERMNKIGNFVRKISIDELPQLLNVLKGDMSLIGPRPLLPEYLPLYNNKQKKRHQVRPGITGWAQVHGRNTINWSAKFNYDVWYVEHLSFLLDVKVLFLTLKKVLVREGISSTTSTTMEKFKGNK